MLQDKRNARLRRKRRIRKRMNGSTERPRLSVYRSALHIYAQVIDDESGRTLVGVSSLTKELRDGLAGLKKKQAAAKVGEELARRCKALNIDKVVFDRNGYRFHGRVSALAEAARKAGLQF
ncbi:MAG: 50S ribosomal protein L18 [Polyangia bacterium]|jgi:large subunit ribosomal protein L18|nr:50S ribosomal protein L18 [Polyangia bacterium]